MNFLAHLYLSGDDKPLRIGNFIGDHVKGKTINLLPQEIKNGVLLHRKIDFFTDNHEIVAHSKERLRPHFHKYAGVVSDIFFDHFLAVHWDKFSDISLQQFATEFYAETKMHTAFLPKKTIEMLPYMIGNNWLVSYATTDGINRVLSGMSRRTPFESNMENGAEELIKNYMQYEKEFFSFFPELEAFVKKERVALNEATL